MAEPIDDLGAPAFASLPGQDVPADRPVEQDQLAADGDGGANLGILDKAFELLKQFRLTEGVWRPFCTKSA